MDGTPARLFTAIRTVRTIRPCLAYSRRYMAASTPNGVTAMLISTVITKVPKMAGKTPPSVLASRGSWLRKAHMLWVNSPARRQKSSRFGK